MNLNKKTARANCSPKEAQFMKGTGKMISPLARGE